MASNKLFLLLDRACSIAGLYHAERRIIDDKRGHLFIERTTCTGRKTEYSIAMHDPELSVPCHPFGDQRLHKSEMAAYLRGMDAMAMLLTGFTHLDVRTYLKIGFNPVIRNRMERKGSREEGGEE